MTVQGDVLDEANETYAVHAVERRSTRPSTTAHGTGTITDNDATPSVIIDDVPIAEGNTGTMNAAYTVTLSAPSGRTVTVNYTTANGTAAQPGGLHDDERHAHVHARARCRSRSPSRSSGTR